MTHNSSQQHQPLLNNNGVGQVKRLPGYTLTGGYDKFTQLQSSSLEVNARLAAPQYVDVDPPLERSYLANRFRQLADAGLFNSKRYRVGFRYIYALIY